MFVVKVRQDVVIYVFGGISFLRPSLFSHRGRRGSWSGKERAESREEDVRLVSRARVFIFSSCIVSIFYE